MEVIVELAGHQLADPGRLLEILERSALHCPGRAEVHQQRPLAVWADAGDLVERRGRQALRPLGPVGTDGEAVRLVAKPLDVEEQGRIRRERDLAAARQVMDFRPGDAELESKYNALRNEAGAALTQLDRLIGALER